MSISDLIAAARPAERSVELCLRSDLVATLEDLQRRAEAAAAAPRDSLGDNPAAGLPEQIAAVKAQMAEATVTVTVRAVPRNQWLSLIADHPPRDGNATDTKQGFNTDAFFESLVRASWATPEVTGSEFDALMDTLSAGQFDELATAAWSVNTRAVSVPFGWRASPATQT